MKMHGALAMTAALVFACASESCPRDEVLVARFLAHEASFEKLLKNPTDEELQSQLGIVGVDQEAGMVHFWAWHLDFVGPGGVLKGYAHSKEEPGRLVDNIDENSSPGSSEQTTLYRRIKANWYLYYTSAT